MILCLIGNCFSGAAKKVAEGGSQRGKKITDIDKKLLPPDFGIKSTHQLIKILGKGGTGETWLCKVACSKI